MNIRDLEYLVAIANHRSFAQAAKESFVSQPALSMQIKKVEDELGVQIFERGNKQILITEIGEKIIEQAKKSLVEIAEIKNLAQIAKNPYAGKLYIGAFPTLAAYFFPKLLKNLHKNFPQLRNFLVEEKTEILIQKLQNGELDCAFLALPFLPETNSVKIFSEKFLLAVPKNHQLAKLAKSSKSRAGEQKNGRGNKTISSKNSRNSKNYSASIELSDLKNRELMLLEDGHCLRSQALEVCALGKLVEMEGFRASSLETLRQMVASGNGITLIPEIAVKDDPEITYLALRNRPKSSNCEERLANFSALPLLDVCPNTPALRFSKSSLSISSQRDLGRFLTNSKANLEKNSADKNQSFAQGNLAGKISKNREILRQEPNNSLGREIYLHWRKNSAKAELISQIAKLTKFN